MKKKIMAILLMVVDVVLIHLGFLLAFYIRFDGNLTGRFASQYLPVYLENAIIFTFIKLGLFYFFGLYRNIWKYASIEELLQVVTCSFVANAGIVTYMMMTQQSLPRSIYILIFLLDTILIGGVRLSYRITRGFRKDLKEHGFEGFFRPVPKKRIMVVGAGQAGAMVIKELKRHDSLHSKPVAIIDDNDTKMGAKIHGVPVLGNRYHIQKIAEAKKIDEIIIAIPSAYRKEIREIVEECSKTKCKLKIVPGIYELLEGQVSIKEIRDVEIDDLLGRDPVKVDLEEISGYLTDKVVLVTGGGGSIGSELCRQIAGFHPKKLLILDIYENSAYDIQNELLRKHDDLDLEVLIASIRDRKRLEDIFRVYRPQVVFHAAAHKHVPLMEANPQEAIKNNILEQKMWQNVPMSMVPNVLF